MKLERSDIEKFNQVHQKFATGKLYHELCMAIGNPDSSQEIKDYLNVESNNYFFWFVYKAFFDTFIVGLDAVFQKSKNSKTVGSIESLKKCENLKRLLEKHKQMIQGIAIIRNNGVAHIPRPGSRVAAMYSEANLSWEGINSLVEDFANYFNAVCDDNGLPRFYYGTSDGCKDNGESLLKAFIENKLPPSPRFVLTV